MYAVQMRGITKRFGSVLASDQVDLKIPKGEVHAIVGENGAGKSTVMKILYGLYQPDAGQIEVFGKPVSFSSPLDAISINIGMVHQHFMLVPPLSVVENIMLGVEPTKSGGRLNTPVAVKKIQELAEAYNLQIDPEEKVENLSVGQCQRVEILKALYRGSELLILDEPTAVLTPLEVKDFFKILGKLKAQGKTIIIITHKLEEVMQISDHITVMRGGKQVGELATKDASIEKLAYLIVGRSVLLNVEKPAAKIGAKVLEIKDLTIIEHKRKKLDAINLDVHAGEIIGIAGVEGNGQTELVMSLTGMLNITSGTVLYKNKLCSNFSAHQIRQLNIAHVPADRTKHGYVTGFQNQDNLILGYQNSYTHMNKSMLDFEYILQNAKDKIKEFDVQPAIETLATDNLSGGNQQKLIVAREIGQNPDLLIISQPTRGVDIGSIEFIHKRIIELRNQGTAILLVSAELEEVRSLSDRAFVFFEGRISGELDLENFDEQKAGMLMVGGANA